MKGKRLFAMVWVLALVLAAQVWAGNGVMDGTGPMVSIYDGEPVAISGTVSDLPAPGNPGLKIDTGTEIVTVYGLGPSWYWENQAVAYPSVGEQVTVEGYKVILSDESERIVATKVTVSGQSIELRDEDGRPAWRGNRGGHSPQNSFRNCSGRER